MELFKLLGKIVIENSDANKALDQTSDKAQDAAVAVDKGSSGMMGAFKKVGAAVATYLTVDAIKDFGVACITAAADANAMESQFSQVFGDLEGKASKSLKSIADEAGISENRMKGSFTKIAAFAKTTGMDTEGALSLSERAMVAVADSAAFYDRSLEETTESLQSFLKGNFENDAALGLSCTETTRNAAANKLYGKSFKDLSESQKQLTLLQMVEDANKASGAMGQAARESDTWTNVTGNLKQAWTDFQAVLGSAVLPGAVKIVKGLADVVETLNEKTQAAAKWCSEHKGAVALLSTAAGTLTAAIIAYTVAEKLKAIAVTAGVAAEGAATAAMGAHVIATNIATAATTAFGAVMSFITSPITLTVAAIAGLIAIVVLLAKNWDKVSEACVKAWEVIKGALSVWGEWINTNVIQPIVDFFSDLWGSIKDIWNKISKSISKAWDTICNVVQVGVMLIAEIIKAAFNIITLPFRFIWENCKEYVFAAWEWIKSKVSAAINAVKNTISKVMNAVKSVFTTVWNAIKSVFSSVWNSIKSVVTSAVNAVKSKVTSVWNSVKSVTSSIWNSVKSVISNVWNSIKSTISNAVNNVKDKISSGLNSAKSTVSNILNNIKSKFTSIFDGVKNTVKKAIDKIKSYFNFSWSLPKLKMPHFSIKGKFSLNPPSVPKLSVDWYKKAMQNAMVLTDPTIFGYSAASGKYLGGGEAGNEVVAGESHLMNMIGQAVESKTAAQTERIIAVLTSILNALLSGNREMLQALLADKTFEVGEREFARLVKKYA